MTITDELLLSCLGKGPQLGLHQAGRFKHAQIPSAEAEGLGVTEELSQRRSPAGGQPVIEGREELNFAIGDQPVPPNRRRG